VALLRPVVMGYHEDRQIEPQHLAA
jgi:hypothetical protein